MVIAEYLKSLPSSNDKGKALRIRFCWRTPPLRRLPRCVRAIPERVDRKCIGQLQCLPWFKRSGAKRAFPNLAKSEDVNAQDPVSLVHLVLVGHPCRQHKLRRRRWQCPTWGGV